LDFEVLSVLEEIPSLRISVQTLHTYLNEVIQISKTLPKTENDIRKFHENAKRLRQAWGNLGGKDIPPELLEFIKSAAGGGFPLPSFSDKLQKLLQHRDWMRYFVVRIRRDGGSGLTR
jgi:hypothetical protein